MRELNDADALLVDGRNLLWRMAFANDRLTASTSEGEVFTGGIYGFLDVILSIMKRMPREADVFIAWEGSKRHRVNILPEYKLRTPDPKWEALAERVNDSAEWLKGILAATGWTQVVAPEWEADDAMGTVARALNEQGENVVILSNDRDMLQCLAKGRNWQGYTSQLIPTKDGNALWTADTLLEEWSVTPEQVPLVKALSGDASDGYKGVVGIGHKWGCKIVAEYQTLDKILEAAREGKVLGSAKKAADIIEYLDYLRVCYEVATIRKDAVVKVEHGSSDRKALERYFRLLKFNSFLGSRHSMNRMLR